MSTVLPTGATALIVDEDGSVKLLLPDDDGDAEMSELQLCFGALLVKLDDPLFRHMLVDYMVRELAP